MEETLQVIEWEETFEFGKDPFPAPQPIPVNEKPSEATADETPSEATADETRSEATVDETPSQADETQRKRGKKRKRNSRKNIEKPRSNKTDKVSFPRVYSILTFRPAQYGKNLCDRCYNLFDVRVYSRSFNYIARLLTVVLVGNQTSCCLFPLVVLHNNCYSTASELALVS